MLFEVPFQLIHCGNQSQRHAPTFWLENKLIAPGVAIDERSLEESFLFKSRDSVTQIRTRRSESFRKRRWAKAFSSSEFEF